MSSAISTRDWRISIGPAVRASGGDLGNRDSWTEVQRSLFVGTDRAQDLADLTAWYFSHYPADGR